jgi:fibronectin type 3 domain-containing protein
MTPLSPTIIERAAEASFAEFNKTYGVETAWADAPDYVQDEVRRFTRAALQSAIPEAVAEERERCAKMADDMAMQSDMRAAAHDERSMEAFADQDSATDFRSVATAIRAISAEQKGEENG